MAAFLYTSATFTELPSTILSINNVISLTLYHYSLYDISINYSSSCCIVFGNIKMRNSNLWPHILGVAIISFKKKYRGKILFTLPMYYAMIKKLNDEINKQKTHSQTICTKKNLEKAWQLHFLPADINVFSCIVCRTLIP